MAGLTPGQQKVIETWTEQRDSLLREIAIHTGELEQKKKGAAEASIACADFERRASEAKGRIAEIDALEERHRTSVAIDVAELEARKSRLEVECAAKADESKMWDARKAEQVSAIEVLILAHGKMSDQATIVDQVVGQVIETSKNAISEMKTTMAEIRTVAIEVIGKGNDNIAQTNIVLEKLPRYIFELQKPIPIRRTYAAPPGTVIEPEQK